MVLSKIIAFGGGGALICDLQQEYGERLLKYSGLIWGHDCDGANTCHVLHVVASFLLSVCVYDVSRKGIASYHIASTFPISPSCSNVEMPDIILAILFSSYIKAALSGKPFSCSLLAVLG